MVLFIYRLTLARSLIKDQQLDFDVVQFKEIYIAWSKDYLGETENEEEIADIVKEAEDWINAFQQVQAARNDATLLEKDSYEETIHSSGVLFRSLSKNELPNLDTTKSNNDSQKYVTPIRP